MTRQSIANYTTKIPVKKTVSEITDMLADAKAQAVLSEFSDGLCTALSFRVSTEFGLLTFRLPANVDGVYVLLQRSRLIPSRLRTREQAARVAWRIIRQWLDAQLAMVQAGLVKLEQIFLPYAQDQGGVSMYERLREARFSNLLKPE